MGISGEALSQPTISDKDRQVLDSLPKIHFGSYSNDTIAISNDLSAPSSTTNMVLLPTSSPEILLSDAIGGVFKNNSTRTLTMEGVVITQMGAGTGGEAVVVLFSERSSDGITWVVNDNSLREGRIPNATPDSRTYPAGISEWQPGHYARFRIANKSSSSANLARPTEIVNNADSVGGFSFYFQLNEV